MPTVDGKQFAYTPEGMLAAKNERLKNPYMKSESPKLVTSLPNTAKPNQNRKTLKKSSNRDAVTKSSPLGKGY